MELTLYDSVLAVVIFWLQTADFDLIDQISVLIAIHIAVKAITNFINR